MTAFAAEAPTKEKTRPDYKDGIIEYKENRDPNFTINPKTSNVDPEFSISIPSFSGKRFSENFEVMPYRPYKVKPIDKNWNRGKIKEKGLKKKAESRKTDNYIFFGDSRTVGMYNASKDTNAGKGIEKETGNEFWLAQVGAGLKWAKETEDTITNFLNKQENGEKKTIIYIGFGINDLDNKCSMADDYVEWLLSLEQKWENAEIRYISINPVSDDTNYSVTNEQINMWNKIVRESLKEAHSKIKFVNLNSALDGLFETSGDGLHYTNSTYEMIYETL